MKLKSLDSSLTFGILITVIGILIGILAGAQPFLLCLAVLVPGFIIVFFTYFEQVILGLLILRSSVDIFSAQQVPAAFGIGLNVLTIIYVSVMLISNQQIKTDKFWYFFAGWVGLQSIWLFSMTFGGLGLDSSYFPASIREFARLFSWLMVYLLVMQLKGKISPSRFINLLMLSLIIPTTVALLQTFLPNGILPSLLVYAAEPNAGVIGAGSRVFGTLGHPNGLAKFLFLFIALTWWQLDTHGKRWYWLLLMFVLVFLLVATQALFGIGMFGVFVLVRVSQQISLFRILAGGLLFAVFIGLFASTELGLERLSSINNTPLLNSDIDFSQAILMSEGNSFNWRIAQWTYLLQAWQQHPIFGYGLNSSSAIAPFYNYAHNDYVRALLEGGIVGFIGFLVFQGGQLFHLIGLYLKSDPKSDARRLHSTLLAVFISFSIGMATDNTWSNTVVYFYWWSILAVAGWDWNQPSENKNQNIIF